MVKPKRPLVCIAALLALTASIASASAATLKSLLDESAGNTAALCLETAPAAAVPPTPPSGRCAADTVAQLYLGLLRERARLRVVRDGIEYFEQALEEQRDWLAGGRGGEVNVDIAGLELLRWQLRELELTRNLRRTEVFFSHVMARNPATFEVRKPEGSAWPADEAAALAVLAARRDIRNEERAAAEMTLRRLWADHQSVQREITLLEPMRAFAADVRVATEYNFSVGQMTLRGLLDHARDSFELEEAWLYAESRRLLAEVRVLELLGRRDALE